MRRNLIYCVLLCSCLAFNACSAPSFDTDTTAEKVQHFLKNESVDWHERYENLKGKVFWDKYLSEKVTTKRGYVLNQSMYEDGVLSVTFVSEQENNYFTAYQVKMENVDKINQTKGSEIKTQQKMKGKPLVIEYTDKTKSKSNFCIWSGKDYTVAIEAGDPVTDIDIFMKDLIKSI